METISQAPATLSGGFSDQRSFRDDLKAFTYKQVAEQLAVSVSTIERLVARGELRELRVGRAVRISAGELSRYLAGGH